MSYQKEIIAQQYECDIHDEWPVGAILRHVQQVTVTTDEDLPWSLDGEYAPSAPRVELRNLPGAIPLMLCR